MVVLDSGRDALVPYTGRSQTPLQILPFPSSYIQYGAVASRSFSIESVLRLGFARGYQQCKRCLPSLSISLKCLQ